MKSICWKLNVSLARLRFWAWWFTLDWVTIWACVLVLATVVAACAWLFVAYVGAGFIINNC